MSVPTIDVRLQGDERYEDVLPFFTSDPRDRRPFAYISFMVDNDPTSYEPINHNKNTTLTPDEKRALEFITSGEYNDKQFSNRTVHPEFMDFLKDTAIHHRKVFGEGYGSGDNTELRNYVEYYLDAIKKGDDERYFLNKKKNPFDFEHNNKYDLFGTTINKDNEFKLNNKDYKYSELYDNNITCCKNDFEFLAALKYLEKEKKS